MFYKLLLHIPWYLLITDLSGIKMLDIDDYQYIMRPSPLVLGQVDSK